MIWTVRGSVFDFHWGILSNPSHAAFTFEVAAAFLRFSGWHGLFSAYFIPKYTDSRFARASTLLLKPLCISWSAHWTSKIYGFCPLIISQLWDGNVFILDKALIQWVPQQKFLHCHHDLCLQRCHLDVKWGISISSGSDPLMDSIVGMKTSLCMMRSSWGRIALSVLRPGCYAGLHVADVIE